MQATELPPPPITEAAEAAGATELPPITEAAGAAGATERPNHTERGREILGQGTEAVRGMFARMGEKFKGLTGKMKEKASSLVTKGANLLFSGVGAGEYFAQKSTEKFQEVKQATVGKIREVVQTAQDKKAEFATKRDETMNSWREAGVSARAIGKIKKKLHRLNHEDRNNPKTLEEVETAQASAMEFFERLKERIAQKEALKKQIDAMRSQKHQSNPAELKAD